MNVRDRAYFPTGVEGFNFKENAEGYVLGLRKYMAKESLDNLDLAKKKNKQLKILHYFVLTFYYLLLIVFYYFLFRLIGVNSFVQNSYNKICG